MYVYAIDGTAYMYMYMYICVLHVCIWHQSL